MYPKIIFSALLIFLVFGFQYANAQKKSNWTAPSSASSLKNPIEPSAASLSSAKSLYTNTCAPCHGTKGRGDGPASVALSPKPADHSSALVQAQSDGAIYWKLTEGRNPMPSYKPLLSDAQRWGLVNYIRTLKK